MRGEMKSMLVGGNGVQRISNYELGCLVIDSFYILFLLGVNDVKTV